MPYQASKYVLLSSSSKNTKNLMNAADLLSLNNLATEQAFLTKITTRTHDNCIVTACKYPLFHLSNDMSALPAASNDGPLGSSRSRQSSMRW